MNPPRNSSGAASSSLEQRITGLESMLQECMIQDRAAAIPLLARARQRVRQRRPVSRDLERLEQKLGASRGRVLERRNASPLINYPQELPVCQRKEEIAELIRGNQVVVVCGETGSGKTTQLPKICLELGRGVTGMIGHTQPRRIAARTVAARIAEEMATPLGQAVGYKVRFTDVSSNNSLVKLMTDGILLAELQQDRDLLAYDTLIIDEAHERSLNIDFLLGYLRQLLGRRPELKLIITSATIDPDRFSRHFDGAPVIEVSGRTYPVDIEYRPPSEPGSDLIQQVVEAVEELPRDHTLVFLSGEREIHEVAEALRRKQWPNTEILPLYARLSVSEQQRVFRTGGPRRVVLATNVAETSLTVPGIRFVVDAGLARISRYSHRSKVQRLPIEEISQAAANQRAGRCGRVRAGVCVRLYSEEEYQNRPAFTDPEILRTNLASVILQMSALGLGNIEDFAFLDPPDPRFVKDGYRLLRELGAVDERQAITRLGRQIARFPVDPVFGRMILAAGQMGCLREVLVITSGLSIQDPRERPLEAREAADAQHAELAHKDSDFLSLLRLWELWQSKSRELSGSQLRRWCREHFLNFLRMREWQDVYQQLRNLTRELKLAPSRSPAGYESVHKALLAGLLGHVGELDEKREYRGARGTRFAIFPGSALARRPPKWLVAASLMETSRLWARMVAKIEPEWIEAMAGHVVQREYGEAQWDEKAGRVSASERVTLYGLTLIAGRKINFGLVDPAQARKIFLREGLAGDRYPRSHHFLEHNRGLLKELEDIEARQRTRGVLLDEERIVAFYEERIPEGVSDLAHFEKVLREHRRSEPDWLCMQRTDLVEEARTGFDQALFPASMTVAGVELPLSYLVNPGSQRDGVIVHVPLPMLRQLSQDQLDWLVPGLLEEKLTAMIRGLPKALRRNFVPAPDFARAAMARMTPGEGKVGPALGRQLRAMTGVDVPPDQWAQQSIPSHLRMGISVEDEAGRELLYGLEQARLLAQLGRRVEQVTQQIVASDAWSRKGLSSWDFEEIPEWVEVSHGATRMRAYPALKAKGHLVDQVLVDTPEQAGQLTRAGERVLFTNALGATLKYTRKDFLKLREANLVYQGLNPERALVEDFLELAVERCFLPDSADLPRSRAAFQARLDAGRGKFVAQANELGQLVQGILSAYREAKARFDERGPRLDPFQREDIAGQLKGLVGEGFLARTPSGRLEQLPRYLKAIGLRLEKLRQDPARDRQRARELDPFLARYRELAKSHPEGALERLRWLLEEYRVSLFAQELGTSEPVSSKRIQALIDLL